MGDCYLSGEFDIITKLHLRVELFAPYGLQQQLPVYHIPCERPVGSEREQDSGVGSPPGSAKSHVEMAVRKNALREVNPHALQRQSLNLVYGNYKARAKGELVAD